jgi:hypothetical protein
MSIIIIITIMSTSSSSHPASLIYCISGVCSIENSRKTRPCVYYGIIYILLTCAYNTTAFLISYGFYSHLIVIISTYRYSIYFTLEIISFRVQPYNNYEFKLNYKLLESIITQSIFTRRVKP